MLDLVLKITELDKAYLLSQPSTCDFLLNYFLFVLSDIVFVFTALIPFYYLLKRSFSFIYALMIMSVILFQVSKV